MSTSACADLLVPPHGPEKGRRGPDPKEDQLYERVVMAVIAKQLRPGERLNENQLARAHGLTRTRVRRVLERLERDHIVRFELNRGASISRPSVKEARDIYEARAFIEEAVIRLVCARPPSELSALPARFDPWLDEEAAAYRRRQPGVNRLSGDFHVLLAEDAGNGELLAILTNLVHRCCLIQSLYEWPQQDLCLNHEHREIVGLIAAGDRDGAIAAIRAHIDHIVASLNFDQIAEPAFDIYAPVEPAN